MNLFQKLVKVLSSFQLAVVLIVLLLVLTFFGTLEQVDHGLYEVQKKYFESLFLVHDLFGVVPIPLPGGYLVMTVFAVNLVVGGIIRMRKHWRNPGVLIIHLGMLVMMAAAYVTFQYSVTGNMSLYENERSNEFQSFYEWNLEITDVADPNDTMLLISDEAMDDLKDGKVRTFESESLPFDVRVDLYARNSVPMQTTPDKVGRVTNIDGFYLEAVDLNNTAEQNVPGAYITLIDKETGEETQGILWGMATAPWTPKVCDSTYSFELARKRWDVPFTLVLDDFRREMHPGTEMAASFESDVTKIEGASSEQIRIYMNHPLRHRGFTFFQASWGMDRRGEEYSVFQVVRNPADQWPLYSCIIIGIGMVIHFLQKLTRYIKLEQKRRVA